MLSIIENTFGKALTISGLNGLYDRTGRNQCVIIIYHRILSQQEHLQGQNGVSLAEFKCQMKYIATNFQCLSLTALGELIRHRKPLPPRSVVITFDDGYLDNYTLAFPVLKACGLAATFFVCPGIIDEQRSFWWDRLNSIIENTGMTNVEFGDHFIRLGTQVEKKSAKRLLTNYILAHEQVAEKIIDELQCQLEVQGNSFRLPRLMQWKHLRKLQAASMEIGAHTMTHASMGSHTFHNGCGEEEIVLSKKHIEDQIGVAVKTFAYPYGNEQHFDPRAVSALWQAGFDLAVSGVVGVAGMGSDIYYLPRIAIQPYDHFSLFKSKVSGLYPDIYRFVRTLIRMTNGSGNHRKDGTISATRAILEPSFGKKR